MTGRDLRDRLAVYAITDDASSPERLVSVCAQALSAGATALQLRRKHDTGRELVTLGRTLRELTQRHHALFFVNDRVDVALATHADGVHIGQDDMPLADARQLMGSKLVGVSASTMEEALTAAKGGADYLGVGSIFPTPSKPDADLCGLDRLKTIAAQLREIPTVAIGGITLANGRQVLEAGADGLALVSAIMQAPDPGGASMAFQRLRTGAAPYDR